MKESLLLPESESVRQNTSEANKECYSEGNLTYQTETKSINTALNFFKFNKRITNWKCK